MCAFWWLKFKLKQDNGAAAETGPDYLSFNEPFKYLLALKLLHFIVKTKVCFICETA